jgi:hypothetical protein
MREQAATLPLDNLDAFALSAESDMANTERFGPQSKSPDSAAPTERTGEVTRRRRLRGGPASSKKNPVPSLAHAPRSKDDDDLDIEIEFELDEEALLLSRRRRRK